MYNNLLSVCQILEEVSFEWSLCTLNTYVQEWWTSLHITCSNWEHWMKNKEKSVQPAGVCNLFVTQRCCWIELWLQGRRLINWGRNGRVKLPQAHIWSMLCCLRKFSFKVQYCTILRTGESPGILQRITERGPLSSNAQIVPGLNTLKMSMCVDSDSIIMLKDIAMSRQKIFVLLLHHRWHNLAWFFSCLYCSVTSICHLVAFFLTSLKSCDLKWWQSPMSESCTLKDAKAATISQYIGCI